MKNLDFYQKTYHVNKPDHIFERFMRGLKPSSMLWGYFVNWDKVFNQIKAMEWHLSLLNCLIGKPNFAKELKALLEAYPAAISVLPLLAVRVTQNQKELQQFTILINHTDKCLQFYNYDFRRYNPKHFPRYLEFLEKTGITELLTGGHIKNLVDYMVGVEAGLDSNARKNRSGKAMETICQAFIEDWCKIKGYQCYKQINMQKLSDCFDQKLPKDLRKFNKKHDFAVKTGKGLSIFEVNFYNTAGSKLDKTASDYRFQYERLKQNGIDFIWITDGLGWQRTQSALREAFDALDYVFSLDMLEKGILTAEF